MPSDKPNTDPSHASVDWEALARYLAGESSATEAERVGRWLAEHPADAELMRALDRAMSSLDVRSEREIDVESALRTVTARRQALEKGRVPFPWRQRTLVPLPRKRTLGWRVAGVLAAAAVVFVAARAVLQRNAARGRTQAPTTAAAGGRVYETAVGVRDSVRLTDGTRVVLGPGTRLVVAADDGKTKREAELHGEAYFEVVHDTAHPFSVRVGGAWIRDVGTSFGVHSDGVARVRVVVTSGAVLLRSTSVRDSGGTTLRAGDVGTVQPNGAVSAERGVSAAQELAWMRGELIFRDAAIAEIAADLRRWYGIELRVSDSNMARQHLKMDFKGDPPERVVQAIAAALGGRTERRGDTVVVRPATGEVQR